MSLSQLRTVVERLRQDAAAIQVLMANVVEKANVILAMIAQAEQEAIKKAREAKREPDREK